jgi:hypothetical protein
MKFIVNIFKLLYYTIQRYWLPHKDRIDEWLRYIDTPRYHTKDFGEPTYNEDYTIREDDEKVSLNDKERVWDRESAPYCETP